MDTLIHKYEIPSSQVEIRSTLVTPVVEVLNKNFQCQDTFAYLADCQTYSIIVYDLKRDTSWKVSDKTMYPHPDYGTYTIQGESFELMDGILGMSLSPASDAPLRKLFFHAMSSPAEHWVYTHHLRNQSLFTDSTPPEIFTTLKGRRRTQAPAEAMDSNGIIYFGLVSDVQIACFNTRLGDYGSYTSSDVIADNPVTLQFASGVKV
ncbi:unnamed protein product [Psylliodes chrysocephalus]|nr:unnamed protein product [Psylliodes chrysocephala]